MDSVTQVPVPDLPTSCCGTLESLLNLSKLQSPQTVPKLFWHELALQLRVSAALSGPQFPHPYMTGVDPMISQAATLQFRTVQGLPWRASRQRFQPCTTRPMLWIPGRMNN